MDINRVGNNGAIRKSGYTFLDNKQEVRKVHPDHQKEAEQIDVNKDRHLSEKEIKDYLRKRDILRDPKVAQVDEEKLLREYKLTLQNKPLPQVAAYHTYDELTEELKTMAEKYPDLCDLVSLGKSYEGRDIWALRISKKPETDPGEPAEEKNDNPQEPSPQPPSGEAPKKPGVIITGLHHAREWVSMEVPLLTAKSMLENYDNDPAMKNRVDRAETWIVPLVNPDGYEYSRLKSFWWRKNRHPITETACDIEQECHLSNLPGGVGTSRRSDEEILGYGVDLNRNYYDGNPENMYLYRAEGDTPCSTWDDKGASDRLSSDTYRGPRGGMEKEIKPLIDLEVNNRNIKAAIDFHSYGRMILYPWGYDYKQVENEEQYKGIAENMSRIISESDEENVRYRPMQSVDLYPARGSSEDFQKANDILGFTIELGRSFAPSESDIEPISRRLLGAQMYLIDYVIENADSLRPDPPPEENQPDQPDQPAPPQAGRT